MTIDDARKWLDDVDKLCAKKSVSASSIYTRSLAQDVMDFIGRELGGDPEAILLACLKILAEEDLKRFEAGGGRGNRMASDPETPEGRKA